MVVYFSKVERPY